MILSASGNRRLIAPWIGVAILLRTSTGIAADPWAAVKPQPQIIVGNLSCTSISCHGGGETRQTSSAVTSRQYVHWLGVSAKYSGSRQFYDPRARLEATDADPHALAAQRMLEPRFQDVLRRASTRADGSVDPAMFDRCAQCHDPLGSASKAARSVEQIPLPLGEGGSSNALTPALSQREREATFGHGIGCESCHGGARDWISRHYERSVSREELLHLGMIDTKNLFTRARQCSACHVGSADQDMNHDMIAAGHPPLRFELASYEALLPRKHWDDRPRRMVEADYEVQLWAAGRIAATDAALALLEGRAWRAAEGSGFRVQGSGNRGQERGDRKGQPVPWPEFAELNCFACHQPLRGSDSQQASGSLAVSRQSLFWRTWDVSLSPLLVAHSQRDAQELPAPSLVDALGRLQQTIDSSLFPTPHEVTRLAATARAALHNDAQISASGSILGSNAKPLDAEAVLRSLGSAKGALTWDDACQRLAALVAAERSLYDRGLIDTSNHQKFVGRMKSIAGSLRFRSADREWPVVFSSTGTSLAGAARQMDDLRTMLMLIAASNTASPGAGLLPAKEAAE
jgi:hypothetical protein